MALQALVILILYFLSAVIKYIFLCFREMKCGPLTRGVATCTFGMPETFQVHLKRFIFRIALRLLV